MPAAAAAARTSVVHGAVLPSNRAPSPRGVFQGEAGEGGGGAGGEAPSRAGVAGEGGGAVAGEGGGGGGGGAGGVADLRRLRGAEAMAEPRQEARAPRRQPRPVAVGARSVIDVEPQ